MGWDAWTAVGTLALAVITFATVVVTIVITRQDRLRSDKRSRQERLWSDAELVADLKQLLAELDPQRSGANATPGPAEDDKWAALHQRTGLAEIRLNTIAISHPADGVRAEAKSLPRRLWGAYTGSRVLVSGLLRNSENLAELGSDANASYRAAVDALDGLEVAITSAGREEGR